MRLGTQLCPEQLACSILKPVSVGTTSELELAAALQAKWDLHMQLNKSSPRPLLAKSHSHKTERPHKSLTAVHVAV